MNEVLDWSARIFAALGAAGGVAWAVIRFVVESPKREAETESISVGSLSVAVKTLSDRLQAAEEKLAEVERELRETRDENDDLRQEIDDVLIIGSDLILQMIRADLAPNLAHLPERYREILTERARLMNTGEHPRRRRTDHVDLPEE